MEEGLENVFTMVEQLSVRNISSVDEHGVGKVFTHNAKSMDERS